MSRKRFGGIDQNSMKQRAWIWRSLAERNFRQGFSNRLYTKYRIVRALDERDSEVGLYKVT